jgi:hypothetical protein
MDLWGRRERLDTVSQGVSTTRSQETQSSMYSSASTILNATRTGMGESPPRRITRDIRSGKLMLLPASLQFASACRKHVLHPLRLAAVRELQVVAAPPKITGLRSLADRGGSASNREKWSRLIHVNGYRIVVRCSRSG